MLDADAHPAVDNSSNIIECTLADAQRRISAIDITILVLDEWNFPFLLTRGNTRSHRRGRKILMTCEESDDFSRIFVLVLYRMLAIREYISTVFQNICTRINVFTFD